MESGVGDGARKGFARAGAQGRWGKAIETWHISFAL